MGKASTTTTVSSSANPSDLGQSVIFTATLSVQSPGTANGINPTGTVMFTDTVNGQTMPLGQQTLTSSNSGVISLTISTLAVGMHTITASYSGDGNFLGSLDSLSQTVNPSGITVADGTVLVCTSPLTGQSAPTGIIGIDPSTGAQSLIATGEDFVLPETIREGPDQQLYVVDYSALGTGAVIAVDPNTGQQSVVATGGNINGPVALAVDNANDSLYVACEGGSAPSLVKIDLNKNGMQTLVSSGGSFTMPAGLAVSPSGDVYWADQQAFGGLGAILTVDVQTGAQTVLTEAGMLAGAYMADLAWDGSGNLLVFNAGSGSGGSVVRVDPTGGQSLVSPVSPDPNLIGLDGGTVDINHGGTIYVSTLATGNVPSQLLAIDPLTGIVRTLPVSADGNLSLVTGLTVFSTAGGGAAAARTVPSGPALPTGVAALVRAGQPDRSDPSSVGASLPSPSLAIPPQPPGMLSSVAAALEAVTMPRAATDSMFMDWEGGFPQQAFSTDPLISEMVGGLATG